MAQFFKQNAENLLFCCVSGGIAAYVVYRIWHIPDVHFLEAVYSSVALAVAVGAAFAVLMPRKVKRNALLLGAALGFSGIIGALAVTISGNDPMQLVRQTMLSLRTAPPRPAPIGQSGELIVERPADNRSVDDVVALLRSHGIVAFRSPYLIPLLAAVDGGSLPLLPLSGIARVQTVNCNEGDQAQFPVMFSDRYGFNNEDSAYALQGDRIALIGDSFVYGLCVHQEQTIAGQLRRRGYAAFGLGVSGNGPLLNLATLREYGPRLRPKTVVWFYTVGNDVTELQEHEIRSAVLTQYLDSAFSSGIADKQALVDEVWRKIWSDPERWKAVLGETHRTAETRDNTAALARVRAAGKEGAAEISALGGTGDFVKLFGLILRTAKRDVESWGGRLFFAPIRGAAYYRLGRQPPHTQAVFAAARAAGLPFIDIDPVINARGGPDRFFPATKDVPHHNAAGYALFADAIAAALAPQSGIRIVDATFGGNCLNVPLEYPVVNIVRPGNATRSVAGTCDGRTRCSFEIENRLVGGDPAGGCVKDFRASWSCYGSDRVETLYVEKNEAAMSAVSLSCEGGAPQHGISAKAVPDAPEKSAFEVMPSRIAGKEIDRFALAYKSYVGIGNIVADPLAPRITETVSILGNSFTPKSEDAILTVEVSVPAYADRISTFVVGIFVNGSSTAAVSDSIEIERGNSGTASAVLQLKPAAPNIGIDIRIGVGKGGHVFLNGDENDRKSDIPNPRLVIKEFQPH